MRSIDAPRVLAVEGLATRLTAPPIRDSSELCIDNSTALVKRSLCRESEQIWVEEIGACWRYSTCGGPIMRLLFVSLGLCLALLWPIARADQPIRPLIFVPGILGTKLCDAQNKVIWGELDSYANLPKLDLSLDLPKLELHPCGPIKQIKVLGPFYTIHQYDSLFQTFKAFGFVEGTDLFTFDYDWRHSSVDSAEKLKTFIDSKIGPGKPFDIVAHSMGGMVTRVYLTKYGKESQARKVVYMGTPFLGSLNTLAIYSNGWGAIQNLMAGGKQTIQKVILSVPGFLELLPRMPECCYVRDTGTNAVKFQDLYDPSAWKANGWLVSPHNEGPNFATFEANLKRAREIGSSLVNPVTNATNDLVEVRIAGDGHDTAFRLGVLSSDAGPRGWRSGMDRGDGTVPLWSAASNQQLDSAAGTIGSFAPHATVFDDATVKTELERELTWIKPKVEWPIGKRDRPSITVHTAGGTTVLWTVWRAGITTSSAAAAPGDKLNIEVDVVLTDRSRPAAGLFKPAVKMMCDSDVKLEPLRETTSRADLDVQTLKYSTSATLPKVAGGVCEVSAAIAEDLTARSYVAVIQ